MVRVLTELEPAVLELSAAFEDVADDAFRRGGKAELDDVHGAAGRHELDADAGDELLRIVVAAGLVDLDDESEIAVSTVVMSSARVRALKNSGVVPEALDLYFDRISRVPLLTGAEEGRLARAIEAGVKAAERGGRSRESELVVRRGDAAKRHFVEANLRLVAKIAKSRRGQGIDYLDLIQYGTLGLIRAVEKFDHRRGYKFSTYGTLWIRQALDRSLADYGRLIRIPVHQVEKISKVRAVAWRLERQTGRVPTEVEIALELEMDPAEVAFLSHVSQDVQSLDAPLVVSEGFALVDLVADAGASVEELVDDSATKDLIREALEELSCRERRVIELRFGLGGEAPVTLDGVGHRFNVTRERIRQIETEAKKKLEPLFSRAGLDQAL